MKFYFKLYNYNELFILFSSNKEVIYYFASRNTSRIQISSLQEEIIR
jgi:hypothetical protein